MPTNDTGYIFFAVQIGKEKPPLVIGNLIDTHTQAEEQLREDLVEFQIKNLGVVEIHPHQEYKVADMSTSALH